MRLLRTTHNTNTCTPHARCPTARHVQTRPLRQHAARGRCSPTVIAFKPAYFPPATTSDAAPQRSAGAQQHTPTVSLPLDYYACMRLSRASGSHAVREALENALNRPPDVGYSAETLSVRAVLLRNAADCLLDLRARKGYDAMGASMGGYMVEVGTQYLPGALVLLQECGHQQLVLELGDSWLAAHGTQDVDVAADVAACMALAHHELAAGELMQEDWAVREACQHLEAALLLLRRARRAPAAGRAAQLQQEIMQLLEDRSPQYCLELLALPLHDPQRQHGCLLLRQLVFGVAPEASPLGEDRDAFLQCARGCLTAQEYLSLFQGVPEAERSLEQQLDVALAGVAVAFLDQQPGLMLASAQAYQRLEGRLAAEAAGSGDGANVSVCRASCALLLGNTPEAVELLGLAEGSARTPQEGVREYVMAHCPDNADLLPGVYALTQCWVREAVLGSFRPLVDPGSQEAEHEQQQQHVELAAWFGAWHVRLYIMVLSVLSRLQRWLAAASRLEQLRALPAAVAASLVWLQQRLLRPQQQEQPRDALAAPAASNRSSSGSDAGSRRAAGVAAAGTALGVEPTAAGDEAACEQEQAAHAGLPQRQHGGLPLEQQPAPASPEAGGAAGAAAGAAAPQPTTKAAPQRRPRSPVLQRLDPSPPPPELQALLLRNEEEEEPHALRPAAAASPAPPAAGAAGVDAAAAAEARHAAPPPPLAAAGAAAAGQHSDVRAAVSSRLAASAAAGAGVATATSMDEELLDEEEGAVVDQATVAARARLNAQLRSLDAQMWDAAPENTVSKLRALLGVALVAAAAVYVAGSSAGADKKPVGFKARVQMLREGRV